MQKKHLYMVLYRVITSEKTPDWSTTYLFWDDLGFQTCTSTITLQCFNFNTRVLHISKFFPYPFISASQCICIYPSSYELLQVETKNIATKTKGRTTKGVYIKEANEISFWTYFQIFTSTAINKISVSPKQADCYVAWWSILIIGWNSIM